MDNKKGGYIIADLPDVGGYLDDEEQTWIYNTKPFNYDNAIALLNSNVLFYVYINGKAEGYAKKTVYKSSRVINLTIHTTWVEPTAEPYARYAGYIISINEKDKTASITMAEYY